MTKELRVAILGGGRMAQQHATAIRLQPQARFVAVGDPYLSAEEIKERFGAEVEGYKSAEELLAKARPDVVHIVSPPHTHFALAKLCLSNGASVYVEKPFAPTAREAAELIDLAEAKNLRVCSAHQVLFQRAGQHYQTFLPKIGDLIHVESYFSFKPVRRRPDGGTPLSAIDQLIDILPHPVYLMLSALERDANAQPELTALDVAPEGEVRAVIRSGGTLATLIVSLRARPVESYLRVVGVNGSVTADFILGDVVTSLGPGSSAPAVVLKPFSTAWQKYWGSYAGVFRLLFRRQKSYPGLGELLTLLYGSVRDPNAVPPLSRRNIMNTVTICEQIAASLATAEARAEELARKRFEELAARVAPPDPARGTVFVTGGSGFLGKRVLEELRNDGWHVRAAVRRTPPARARVPGIEYVEADLGRGIDPALLAGVSVVAHCAAETAGNQQAHERNTVVATTKLLDSMEAAGVKKLINIGSVAVLKAGPSVQREDSVVDRGNLGRGPYVWAKAEAECLADDRAKKGTVEVRTVRLGPLVDFSDYTPPGRLGRDIAKTFIGMGSRGNALSVLDTQTAARVIRWYADEFEAAPRCVNLVEVPATTRGDLADRMKATRPELRFFWLPFWLLKLLSWFAIGLQKVLKPKAPALDVYAAFKSEKYDPAISQRVIAAAGPARPPRVAA